MKFRISENRAGSEQHSTSPDIFPYSSELDSVVGGPSTIVVENLRQPRDYPSTVAGDESAPSPRMLSSPQSTQSADMPTYRPSQCPPPTPHAATSPGPPGQYVTGPTDQLATVHKVRGEEVSGCLPHALDPPAPLQLARLEDGIFLISDADSAPASIGTLVPACEPHFFHPPVNITPPDVEPCDCLDPQIVHAG